MSKKQKQKIEQHAETVSARLNLYSETAAEILGETLRGCTATLDLYTTPECYHRRGSSECGHNFPAHFLRDAKVGRAVAALRHYAALHGR